MIVVETLEEEIKKNSKIQKIFKLTVVICFTGLISGATICYNMMKYNIFLTLLILIINYSIFVFIGYVIALFMLRKKLKKIKFYKAIKNCRNIKNIIVTEVQQTISNCLKKNNLTNKNFLKYIIDNCDKRVMPSFKLDKVQLAFGIILAIYIPFINLNNYIFEWEKFIQFLMSDFLLTIFASFLIILPLYMIIDVLKIYKKMAIKIIRSHIENLYLDLD